MLKPEYSGIPRLIPLVMMPWLLASPGHQQPYWLCRIHKSLSSMKQNFNNINCINYCSCITSVSSNDRNANIFLCFLRWGQQGGYFSLSYQLGLPTVPLDTLSTLTHPPPSAAYMRQWMESALVQIMACCLFGAKPLSKPMLGYCQLSP